VLTPVPSGKSRLHHRNACRASYCIRVPSGTQGSNLAIPPHQSGPVNQLGRARCEEGRGVEPRGRKDRHGCSKPAAAPAAHLPSRNEEVPTPTARAAGRFRGGARHPAGSRSTFGSPARCEQAGDGGGRSARCSTPFGAHTLSKRSRPPAGSSSISRRRSSRN